MFGPTWARRVWAAVIAGVVTFLVCSVLPLWRAYPFSAHCTFGSECNLWQLAQRMNYPEEVVEWEAGTVITTVAVQFAMLAGGSTGWVAAEVTAASRAAPRVADSRRESDGG